jgi:hypothetical protein
VQRLALDRRARAREDIGREPILVRADLERRARRAAASTSLASDRFNGIEACGADAAPPVRRQQGQDRDRELCF